MGDWNCSGVVDSVVGGDTVLGISDAAVDGVGADDAVGVVAGGGGVVADDVGVVADGVGVDGVGVVMKN